jgi:Bacterial antitoxin of type II TA system, VapB
MTAVNIPDEVLERVLRVAHAATPQEAVLKALEEFARKHD